MSNHPDVAIVGAGFCGTLLAVHLARSGRAVTLIDRGDRFGPGLAYGAAHPRHLLNTPAGRMSAFADDPDHFTRWARARDPGVTGGSFLPRRAYGSYLEGLLEGLPITCLSDQVTDLTPHGAGFHLTLTRGPLQATRVALAVGNLPPVDPPAARHLAPPRYHRDPWTFDPTAIDPAAAVLLLGSGLTALDLALTLADAGHRGDIHLASRRGLVPQPHRPTTAPPQHVPRDLSEWPATARGYLHALRREIHDSGADWRDTIAALRPHTAALWRRLSLVEQDRFLRHLRAYWDVHRHRAAPETHRAITELRARDQLHVHAATLAAATATADHDALDITLTPRRASPPRALRVAAILNCTGPATDLAGDPLLARLHARGLIQRDAHGLGLATDEAGAVSPNLYLTGPLRRADDWESTAVLELSAQVATLAAHLAAHLAR
jgi:uncharacterized NAD(P)/FAD-binding protein YdhS